MTFGYFLPVLNAPLIFEPVCLATIHNSKGENLLPSRPIERLKKSRSTAAAMSDACSRSMISPLMRSSSGTYRAVRRHGL